MIFFAFTALVSAIAVSATPRLLLNVVGPGSVVDINGLTIKTILKNTGDETLKLLNDPCTVLSTAKTDTFNIRSISGPPAFTGIKVKYVPSLSAALSRNGTFTTLAPGKTIEVIHNLAGAYDFTSPGPGMYHFSAANIFNYVDATGAIKTIYAQANSEWFVLEGRRLAQSARAPALSNSGVTYTSCSATQQAEISAAATASNEYVAEVKRYLAGISTTNKTPRYTTWFGDFTTERYNVVVDHFSKIGTDATSTNYDCGACAIDHTVDYDVWMAYVYPDSPGKIYLCGNFWEAPLTGPDSRAGTIIRGNSYFEANGKTYDITYGQDDAKKLVKTDPGNAIWNADSYEYFAENSPVLP